jgi:hypothetical protein
MWHGLVPGRDALLDCFRTGRVVETGWILYTIVEMRGLCAIIVSVARDCIALALWRWFQSC